MDERDTYLRGFIYSLGFKNYGIEHVREERKAGKTKFNFFKYIMESFKNITNHTIAPLRMATLFGLMIMSFKLIFLKMIYSVIFLRKINV